MAEKFVYNPLEGPRPEAIISFDPQPTEELISIIVVHRDTSDYLSMCLQSIAVASANNNYELIVVDNGSTSTDAVEYLNDLEEMGDVRVIRNRENLWWPKAANLGAKAASKSSKYFVFMHADTIVLNPMWLDFLINVTHLEGSGLVGTKHRTYVVDGKRMDYVEEHCMLVSKECWKDCGPFTEELPVVGSAFIFTLAAQLSNHKPQVLGHNLVHHWSIFGLDISEYERLSEQAQITMPKLIRDLQLAHNRKAV